MMQRHASDIAVAYGGNTVWLKPSLRAATNLEALHGGFPALLSKLHEFDTATIRVVREIETNRAMNAGDIDAKLFGVQNRAAQTARQLAAEYGLSPISRARIGNSADDGADDDNPLNVR